MRWAGLLTIGWRVACLVQSIATVSFTGPPVFALFFGLVGVVASLSQQPEAARNETARDDEKALDEPAKGHAPAPGREERLAGRE